jgi:N,N'-diacetyllegionaminate synthase
MNDDKFPVIRIGDAQIRRGGSVYLIAEASVNHNGQLRTALEMVDAAVLAGANAIKFQAFRAAALVTDDAPAAAYQRAAVHVDTQRAVLEGVELAPEDFVTVAQHCDAAGIEFLATPFGVEELNMLVNMGVRAIKTASSDITNTPLLIAAAETGLPLIVSTGAAEPEEIDAAVSMIEDHGAGRNLVLLHCVSTYPTRTFEANLHRIETLANRYHKPTGFSDHTMSARTGAIAAACGGVVIEKHFTLDRHQTGSDHAFSLEPDQLREYITRVREAETMLGDGSLGMLNGERETRRLTRSSVVADVPIAKGERIKLAKLTVKRPGTGIPPTDLDKVAGRAARVDIPADTQIQWDMLQ